eukprot:gnl/TRDRNA2_/TRDRNA2_181248_c0_seq1.p1 gnl/TRDRNA2_/TRDRNA2_181248_c0~~gnl/TRDRNA2_/TRDRNA2_181248_c0_seq1.p1  ORF type:complete len:313 (+),score=62.42 gnl/TRDRNA2_/TRDRNA2_181248_c0_seq1:114-1052(+)
MGSVCCTSCEVAQHTEWTNEACSEGDSSLMIMALRVFDLVDTDHDGELDLSELTCLDDGANGANSFMKHVDSDASGKVSKAEWLKHMKNIADKNPKLAAAVLELQEKQIAESHFSLKDQALRIFRMADKDLDGLLDLDELTTMCSGRAGWADSILKAADAPLPGTAATTSCPGEDGCPHCAAPWSAEGLVADVTVASQHEGWGRKSTKAANYKCRACAGSMDTHQPCIVCRRCKCFWHKSCTADAHRVRTISSVTKTCGRADRAESMMENVHAEKKGKLTLSEWLAYVKRLSDKNQKSAAAVLKLYEKQVSA